MRPEIRIFFMLALVFQSVAISRRKAWQSSYLGNQKRTDYRHRSCRSMR
ncbi:MAG: hypothetical protein KA731_02525 [Candidatus Moranbacteria bacterium]|nr:hypothetical protein [Candidatus Moranbacteria bacterium]MBP6034179.1 hypothetical protein [Candidatus Moranbacteria bacterium]MBP7696135.1 hypothetical protein [Candidatus Moranbacteria bacterium]